MSGPFSNSRQQQHYLETKLGSLYYRIYQLHNEQYNIYPPFNNYEQYRIYCTQRLSRLRHCNYKMIVTKEVPEEALENNRDFKSDTDGTKTEPTTTTTTTTTIVVKSLLLHNSKYSNAIPPLQSTPALDTIALTPSKQTSKTASSNSHKRAGGGSNSKHAYHSRKVVYENILHPSAPDIGRMNENHTIKKATVSVDSPGMDIYYHENVIWNLFYQAERAWAHACALLLVQQQSSIAAASSTTGSHVFKKKLSNHRHVQNRFNKAMHWSQLLYNTVKALLSPETESMDKNGALIVVFVQECYAYMKWMEGNAAIEHKDYVSAYKSYSQSIRTLSFLHQYQPNMDTSTASLLPQSTKPQDYYEKWKWHIENVLRPLVRYCQYEMKGMEMKDAVGGGGGDEEEEEDILLLMDQQQGSQAVVPRGSTSSSLATTIRFRNVTVNFDHQLFSQQITVAYLKLEPPLLSLASSMKDGYDSSPENDDTEGTCLGLMSDLDDLMSLVLKEYKVKFNVQQSSSVAVSPQQQQQQLMYTTFYAYLKYYKLSMWRRQQEMRIKDALLQSESEGNSINNNSIFLDMIHLYTTLQQIVLSMNELIPTTMMSNTLAIPGTPVDEDDVYTLEAQAHIARVRAFRCYYMAQYYEMIGLSYSNDMNDESQQDHVISSNVHLLQQQQYVAARSLLQHSQLLTKRAIEEISACEDDATLLLSSKLIHTYTTELEQVNVEIKAMFCRLDATQYLLQRQWQTTSMDLVAGGRLATKSLVTAAPTFPLNPDRPLWMQFEEENDKEEGKSRDTTWADVPPLPIPLPCKSVFFDIAARYIDEVIQDEIIRPLVDHSALLDKTTKTKNLSTLDMTTETATTSQNSIFSNWFSSK